MSESLLGGWSDFYVIVGGASAALTGLQFVVITLSSERQRLSAVGVRAFATPTIVHFCAVLLMSAFLTAPWHRLVWPALALKGCGLLGIAYVVAAYRSARRQKDYAPDLEDVTWHFILPTLSYLALLGSAVALARHADGALFAVALLQIALLFIGIHNAWDAAVYIASQERKKD